jgi:hypothetical protein
MLKHVFGLTQLPAKHSISEETDLIIEVGISWEVIRRKVWA